MPPSLQAAAITVRTNIVEVSVVVRDSRGRPIGGLKRDDFKVLDDGKQREISGFSVQTFAPAALAETKMANQATNADGETAVATEKTAAPPVVAARPRFVALYFDDVHTQPGDLGHAQIAAKRFLKEALAPGDRVAIFTNSSDVTLDFATDVAKLADTIDRLKSHPRISENGLAACPRITPYQAYLIANNLDSAAFDAALSEAKKCNCDDQINFSLDCAKHQEQVVTAQANQTWGQARTISEGTLATIRGVVGYLAKMPGDRMLLLTSSGFLEDPFENQQDRIINDALRAGVVINALDAKGLYSEPPGRPFDSGPQDILPAPTFFFEARSLGDRLVTQDALLADFAASTGGVFFHNRNDLDFGFREAGMMPEVSYLLSFAPEGIQANGKFHKLKVQVAGEPHAFVQSRPGYFAPTKASEAEAKAAPPESAIDREIVSDEATSALAATATTRAVKNASGKPELVVTVHIGVDSLQFVQREDRSTTQIEMVAALFDAGGNFVTGAHGEMDLALKENTLEQMKASGINPRLTLEAPEGSYRLRVVAQDGNGKMYTASQNITVAPQ